MRFRTTTMIILLIACSGSLVFAQREEEVLFARAAENSRRFDQMARAMQRTLKGWVRYADPQTLLLPDHLPGVKGPARESVAARRLYRPKNCGADLYSYLVLAAHLADPDLYDGRMLAMLRNEIRYTTVLDSIPANLEMATGELGPATLFGAAEYAKDGLLTITELLGRTPWFYRMVDITADVMKHAPVKSSFGNLPSSNAEVNGDLLQVLVRLATMTGDRRFTSWARRIGDAYLEEVLPGNHGLPSFEWSFEKHSGDGRLQLRDHGNEIVMGLSLLYAFEQYHETPRAERYRPGIAKMLDRILDSANSDGIFFNLIDTATLKPINDGLSDNWGPMYCAVYTFYQATGEVKYRDAVRKVLYNISKYRNYPWEGDSFDGYADAIEGALYLVAREPVPEAFDWIESEIQVMVDLQHPSGFSRSYGDGNFIRTLMLYMLYKSQGCRPAHWVPGLRVGAVRQGDRLYLSVQTSDTAQGWNGRITFDLARHKRVLNFDKNYARLNEFPEWYTVEENTLYRLSSASGGVERISLGSELIRGIRLEPGNWIVQPVGKPPYGPSNPLRTGTGDPATP